MLVSNVVKENEPQLVRKIYDKSKEYKDVVIGVGANYTGAKTLEYIGFWSSCFLIMHHYKLPYLTFSVIGLLNMPLGYITALIWWYVCDNLGFLPKKQERKVYLVYGLMMAFGISTIIFDYSLLFDQSSKFIITLNSFEGMNDRIARAMVEYSSESLCNVIKFLKEEKIAKKH